MARVGSCRDVSSGGEAEGVWGLDEAFLRAGHPCRGSAAGVAVSAPSLRMN